MWIIIKSDGDIDYTTVYGPFTSYEEATSVCPDDSDDYAYRVEMIQPVTNIL